ncbi:MAG: hypothetical protein VCA36_13355 [Opitutales bacterium]
MRETYPLFVKITGEMQGEILSLRASGTPTAEIAKKVGLSVSSVQRIARTTAYHEAGHAAVGAIFGQHPDWATLIPDPKTNILAEVTQVDGDLESEEGLKAEIINCYAGQCAELRVGGSARRARLGAGLDDEVARRCIVRILGEDATDGEVNALEKEMRKVAAEFVDEHWALVERIASELLEHTTLVLEELESLRAIYQGEDTEEHLTQLRKSLADLDKQCRVVGKTAVYKGPSKEFGPDIISTWSCE